MKTRVRLILAACCVVALYVEPLSAQKHIEQLFDQCESMDKVEVHTVIKRDKTTRKLERKSVSIQFKRDEHPKLIEQILKAFKTDRDDAYQIDDVSKDGKTYPSYYRFNRNGMEIRCSADFNSFSWMSSRDNMNEKWVILVWLELPADKADDMWNEVKKLERTMVARNAISASALKNGEVGQIINLPQLTTKANSKKPLSDATILKIDGKVYKLNGRHVVSVESEQVRLSDNTLLKGKSIRIEDSNGNMLLESRPDGKVMITDN